MSSVTFLELSGRESLVLYLEGLYPHLKRRDLALKLSVAGDAGEFMFFRSYIPYFYDLLRRLQADAQFPDLHGLESIDGWCVGDAHPENFGVVYCRAGSNEHDLRFAMNDADDGGPGPLYADLLRFLTAVRLMNQDLSLEPVINAYRQGLDGDVAFSPVVAREIAAASRKPDLVDNVLRPAGKGRFKPSKKARERFRFKRRVAKKHRKAMSEGIETLFQGRYSLCGLWSLKKRGGGSAGLRRYWALLAEKGRRCGGRRSLKRKHQFLLDFKTLGRSALSALVCDPSQEGRGGYSLLCSDEPAAIMNRIGETLDLERGLAVSRYCDVVKFEGLPPMIVRARWRGNRGIDVGDAAYTRRELSQLMKDEAKVLGQIHRKSLPEGSRYAAHIYTLSASLVQGSEQLQKLIRRAYQLIRES